MAFIMSIFTKFAGNEQIFVDTTYVEFYLYLRKIVEYVRKINYTPQKQRKNFQ